MICVDVEYRNTCEPMFKFGLLGDGWVLGLVLVFDLPVYIRYKLISEKQQWFFHLI
jgi:hypothetical protein